jgi:predicted dehydrogenase
MNENVTSIVVIGAGRAFFLHYLKPLADLPVRILGIVDPAFSEESRAHEILRTAWVVPSVAEIPDEAKRPEVIAIVLTPDHYPVIVELADAGFKRIMVEKPLVHRDDEVEKLQLLIESADLHLYATDSYILKLLPLLLVLGLISEDDPRRKFVQVSGEHTSDLKSVLGKIEGVNVQIIEGGDFCLPDLATRPWLEVDPEIGGVLLDLGIHALAPLVATGLVTSAATVHHVGLAKLSSDRSTLVPISSNQVELYVSALLTDGNIPIQMDVGKVPFNGGTWTFGIRGENAMFYAGLRTEKTSVLVTHGGKVTQFTLPEPAYAMVIEEALMYFRNDLPGFDGNISAFFQAREVLRRLKRFYFHQQNRALE